ncbi:EpsG family protein [Arenimonas caeni]|uniref:EpsG family protein n=1 Tax=Arenimonas caeni TaxID=2058085 RepID=A0A2P6MBN1_9GAMM|nr:EpsG family protein [Arenimonas caeni]PRH83403.1 hypothetical protein C6N40_01775 [Arenimonas caeni]
MSIWPYLAFFALAGLPALLFTKRVHRGLWVAVWFFCILFVGLRHQVGGDWEGYLLITQRIYGLPLADAIKEQELLFSLLTWLSSRAGFGVYGVNVIGAVIFFSGLFAYCRKLQAPWLALAASLPFLVVVAVMSANRQGIAIGIVLYVMSVWDRWSVLKRSAGIALAALFHASAAVLLVLSVVDLKISRWKKGLLFLLVGSCALWLLVRSEAAFLRYTQTYISEQPEGVYSPGALFHLLLNLVPALLILLYRRKWRSVVPNWPLIRQLSFVAIGLALLVPFFSVAAGRFSLYLFPISLIFVSSLPSLFRHAEARALVRTILVVLLAMVLIVWLAFANTANTYHPYQNVLMLDAHQLELPK